jgi:hypothetical protein
MRVTVLGLAVALLCAACSGGAGEAAVPAGYTLYESDTLRFAYPQDWEDQGDTGIDDREVDIRGEQGQDSVGVVLAAYRKPGLGTISLEDYGEGSNIEFGLKTPGRQVVSEEPFRLADGTAALRYEATYESRDAAGEPIVLREQLVLARVGDDGLVLRCAAEDQRFGEFAEDCATIASTFAPAS